MLDRIKSMGYAGVELPVCTVMTYGSAKFASALKERGLKFIGIAFSDGPNAPGNAGLKSEFGIVHPASSANTRDIEVHKACWAAQVDECVALRDLCQQMTSHTGRDYFTEAQADDMLGFCVRYAAEKGIRVNHETHRARIMYSPWVMPRILSAHPGLTLVADLSHFTVVAEATWADPELEAVVRGLIPRVRHTHGRVGFEEGPQIGDPRRKYWAAHLEGFKVWWDAIFEACAAAGDEVITSTPEFGPAPYMPIHTVAGEDVPTLNVRVINHWIAQELSAIFAARFGEASAAKMSPVCETAYD